MIFLQTMSTLCQPSRACLYQSPEHIQNFHAALKKAGFIGGRRGASSSAKQIKVGDADEMLADEDEGEEEIAAASLSKGKKRRSTIKSGARKSKRAKQDMDDPSMKSPPPEDFAALDYNAEERGPDEILPDRALTKAERLMLVNQVPRNLVELHVLVEEVEIRFNESQINELLALIHANLPLPPTDEEANDPNAQQQEMQDEYADEEAEYAEEEDAGPVDWDTLEMNAQKPAAPAPAADASMATDSAAPLFMGGDEEEEEGYGQQDDDEWVNDHVGRGGDDDLAGPGGDDDD